MRTSICLHNDKIFCFVWQYFESLLLEYEEQHERDISAAVKDSLKHNTKLQKIQAKLDKGLKEKKFLDEVIVICPYLFSLIILYTMKNIQ